MGNVSRSETLKVGDKCKWADVPTWALVRSAAGFFYVRVEAQRGDRSVQVGRFGRWPSRWLCAGAQWGTKWPAPRRGPDRERVIIVATGLTGRESADDLRRMAEVFEVREAVEQSSPDVVANIRDVMGEEGLQAALVEMHARLVRAGWRPGMTAEDAARLLAEAGR